jgi:hypothetical protein
MPNRPARRAKDGAPKRRRRGIRIWTPPATRLLQLKITLQGIAPPIWRRIVVPDNYSLETLHSILQDVLGWTNSHMHGFYWQDESWGPPSMNEALYETRDRDERQGFLGRFFAKQGDQMLYEYDFGDSWEHVIELESDEPFDPARPVPICLAGARACPPEDCGGTWGYADLMKARKRPHVPKNAERLEWLGDYDPEHFDLEEVNRFLRPAPSA